MKALHGTTHIALDGNGRMTVPTRYRNYLTEHGNGQIVMTLDGTGPFLLLFPLPDWEQLVDDLHEKVKENDQDLREFMRFFIGHAEEMQCDRQWRVPVSPALREAAELNRKVSLVGINRKFELWDEERWRKWRSDCQDGAGVLPRSVQNLFS